jgi:hypothetical protein
MKSLIAVFALLSFVAASTIPYAAQAQTQAGGSKSAGTSHKAPRHKTARKVQEARRVPVQRPAPAAPTPILEERGGAKMGM